MGTKLQLLTAATICLAWAGVAQAQIANDTSDTAMVVDVLPFEDTHTTLQENAGDDYSTCFGNVEGGAWYVFTAPHAGRYRFSFSSSVDSCGAGHLSEGSADNIPSCSGFCYGSVWETTINLVEGDTWYGMIGTIPGTPRGDVTFGVEERFVFDLTGFTLTGGTVNPRTGVPTVTGAVTCNKDGNVYVSGTLRQKIDRRTYANASFSTSVACVAGHATNWSAVGSNDRPFVSGTVSIAANADGSACDQYGCENDSAQTAADVHIKPKR